MATTRVSIKRGRLGAKSRSERLRGEMGDTEETKVAVGGGEGDSGG